MQTFLPYPDYLKSVHCLDDKRLNNQINEATVIINTLLGKGSAWKNHPAVKMWSGYALSLIVYRSYCINEWEARGKNNSRTHNPWGFYGEIKRPFWFGDYRLHASHRSNLLRKNYEWYGKFGWAEPNDLPYFWPVE